VAAAALALGTGAAFGANTWLRPADDGSAGITDPSGASGRSGEPATELVVNNLPDLSPAPPSFADGFDELWTFDFPEATSLQGVAVGPEAVLLDDHETKTGVERSTGEELWSATIDLSAYSGFDPCVPGLGTDAVCIFGGDVGHFYLIDTVTGAGALDSSYSPAHLLPSWDSADSPAAPAEAGFCAVYATLVTGYLGQCYIGDIMEGQVDGTLPFFTDTAGQVVWLGTAGPGGCEAGDSFSCLQMGDEYDGIMTAFTNQGYVVDIASGTELLESEPCGSPQVFNDRQVWCGSSRATAGEDTREVTVDGSAPVTIHFGAEPAVFWAGPHPRDQVVALADGVLRALDPATGQETWTVTLGGPGDSSLAWNGASLIAAVDESGQVWVVDRRTGEVVSETTVDPMEVPAGEWAGVQRSVGFIDQKALAIETTSYGGDDGVSQLYLLDATSGEEILARELIAEGLGYGAPQWSWSPDPSTDRPFLAQVAQGQVIYMEPSEPGEPPAPRAPPEPLPSCPDGQEPLAWSRFTDGYALVCADEALEEFWAAAMQDEEELIPLELDFADDTWSLTFADDEELVVSLDGPNVIRTNGLVTIASDHWSWRSG
jgi:outer membrane protein assembly factor BamB